MPPVRWCQRPLWVKSGHAHCTNECPLSPNSDRESEILQKAMSALTPKADMCSALLHVCFGPLGVRDRAHFLRKNSAIL
jgi:hypothetical protein